MLHIVRKNESITDIARIYKATAESISNANNLDEGAQLYENSSIWVPKDKYVRFTQSAITTRISKRRPIFWKEKAYPMTTSITSISITSVFQKKTKKPLPIR